MQQMCFISNRTLFYRSYSGSIAGAILPYLPSLLIDTIVRWLMTMIVTRLPKAPKLVRIYTSCTLDQSKTFWREYLILKVKVKGQTSQIACHFQTNFQNTVESG